jgi:hypothetical protein
LGAPRSHFKRIDRGTAGTGDITPPLHFTRFGAAPSSGTARLQPSWTSR